jgi:urease accessory protein
MQPWQANLTLRFALSEGSESKTVLANNAHSGPLRVQKALYPEASHPAVCHAVIVHPPAGIAAGDALAVNLTCEANTHAVISTPGATQWYKSSADAPARMAVQLQLDAQAKLDWLPQENILFDHSHAHLHTHIALHPSASAIGWDVCVLGRGAAGETWQNASLAQRTTITRGEQPLWIEHSQLSSNDVDTVNTGLRHNTAALVGHSIIGTLWAVGERASSEQAQTFAVTLPYTTALKAGHHVFAR